MDSGVECLRRGLRVSPSDYRRSFWLTLLASGLLRQRHRDEAIATARAACRSDANFYPARLVLAAALLRAGQKSEAGKALLDARRIRPQMQRTSCACGSAAAGNGNWPPSGAIDVGIDGLIDATLTPA